MRKDRAEVLSKADELIGSMGDFQAEVAALRAYGKRNRALIWMTMVSVSLAAASSVALGWVAIKADRAAQAARHATSVAAESIRKQVLSCEVGNEQRRAQRELWDYVLKISADDAKGDKAKAARRVDFRVYLTKTLAPRDCEQYRSPTVGLNDLRPKKGLR